ncbi:HEPN domain-containing protein [Sphingomonas azotifigens]|uniref:HEPN domain-containing protein n=1 Tax=Sphingomonas azotifigens TaxID=330920 RepID=UPI00111BFA36|nr:HEPN domain-containing protein [Sphingomonas azotifigens]
MAEDAIEVLYNELTEASKHLLTAEQPSLSITLEDIHRKCLLLAVASYFEYKLSETVVTFCSAVVGNDSPILELVKSKAIARQYHTWFDWNTSSAAKFFALFGQGFKKFAEQRIKADENLSQGVKDFMSLGSDRNRLVHQNFGSFALESTPMEIMERYRSATRFVETVPTLLREHLAALGA